MSTALHMHYINDIDIPTESCIHVAWVGGGGGALAMLKYTGMVDKKGPTLSTTLLCGRVYILHSLPKKYFKESTFQALYSVKGSTF